MHSTIYLAHLFIISAPSGAGKSSLINAYLALQHAPAKVAISHTTRAPRPGEVQGQHYYFINEDRFQTMIAEKEFLEHAHVFHHYYGTSKQEIEGCLEKGIDVFLDIDWQGAQQVCAQMPQAKSIFILPPSLAELEKRLRRRGQDSEEVIQTRLARALSEISHYQEYDYLIVNDNFDISIQQLNIIVQSQKLTLDSQQLAQASLLETFKNDTFYRTIRRN